MSTVCIPYLHCIPLVALYGQLLLGLINGSFYALLSLGLAVIFGMLQVVNFAHGALYMLGAFVSWWLLSAFGVNYWAALAIAPLIVALMAMAIEKSLLRHIYQLDPLYGLLLTFGVAQVLEGTLRYYYGSAGQPYSPPDALQSTIDVGFIILPMYRAWVVVVSIVVCLATWLLIERTKVGAYLRAATENPTLVQCFGVNVPLIMTLTFGLGAALAAFAGVLAAPIYQVSPLMGTNIIVIVFAVVVAGGMGSILGSIVTGYVLGVLEGLTKVFYPEAANIVVFVVMAVILLFRPAGFFGRAT
jgi:branched-chain amino acid transport system permease protein